MQVKNYMVTTLHTITPKESVFAAAKIMKERGIGSILVEENGKKVSVITQSDIVNKVVAMDRDPQTVTVKEVMTSPLIMIDATDSVFEAARMMKKYDVKRLAVLERGNIVGVITAHGITEKLERLGK